MFVIHSLCRGVGFIGNAFKTALLQISKINEIAPGGPKKTPKENSQKLLPHYEQQYQDYLTPLKKIHDKFSCTQNFSSRTKF